MLREKLLSQIEALEKAQKTATSTDEIRGLSREILQLSKDIDEYDRKTQCTKSTSDDPIYQAVKKEFERYITTKYED